MCHFCTAQLFEITHAANIKSPLEQHSYQDAKVVERFCDPGCRLSTRCSPALHADKHVASCCRRACDRERWRRAISIVARCQPVPNSPRLRALALFGRRPHQRVACPAPPASENLTIAMTKIALTNGVNKFA